MKLLDGVAKASTAILSFSNLSLRSVLHVLYLLVVTLEKALIIYHTV